MNSNQAIKKIGVIGLGKMGILHSGIFNALSGCRISALCDTDSLLIRIGKKMLPDVSFYTDSKKMVSQEDLDAIVITTPIQTHNGLIENILSNNSTTGIFVEKPLTTDFPEATKLANLAKEKGVITTVGFQKRHSPVFRMGKQLLDEGILGDLFFFNSYSYVSYIFKTEKGWRFQKGSGGALLELGCHLVDLLLWYFGDSRQVKALQRHCYSPEVDDYIGALMEFNSGLVGNMNISWSIRNYRLPETSIQIHGSNGVLTVNEDCLKIQLDNPRGEFKEGVTTLFKQSIDISVPFLLADPEFVLQDEEFLECLSTGKATSSSFNDATRVHNLIDQIYNEIRG